MSQVMGDADNPYTVYEQNQSDYEIRNAGLSTIFFAATTFSGVIAFSLTDAASTCFWATGLMAVASAYAFNRRYLDLCFLEQKFKSPS